MAKKPNQSAKKQAPAAPLTPTGKLQLLAVRLVESMSKIGTLKPNELPGHATQAVNATLGFSQDDKAAFFNLRIKLDASYDGDKTKDPAVSILASFVANYSIVEMFSDEEIFKKFAHQIGMLTIWPFWREFAQSMTTRMGLPAFPVPLINLGEIRITEDTPKN
jgi:hypothetical protein